MELKSKTRISEKSGIVYFPVTSILKDILNTLCLFFISIWFQKHEKRISKIGHLKPTEVGTDDLKTGQNIAQTERLNRTLY